MRASRRRLLWGAAGATLAVQMGWLRSALAAGSVEKGVYRVKGDVRINGKKVDHRRQHRAGVL